MNNNLSVTDSLWGKKTSKTNQYIDRIDTSISQRPASSAHFSHDCSRSRKKKKETVK